jgi:Tannase and feruloyl esterase
MRMDKVYLQLGWAIAVLASPWGFDWAQAAQPDSAACAALKDFPLQHARVVSASYDAGGSAIPYKSEWLGGFSFDLPASCRVKLMLSPSSDSRIEMEIWMPAKSSWNHKLWSNGNGGLGGSIDELGVITALARGYASSGTDTGHHAMAIDGSWALGHPEKRIDYGYRAIHETAVASKILIRHFYGQSVAHAYFAGGSNGGRAALQEAQRYPDDYDGIEAAAPAQNGANTVVAGAWMEKQLRSTPQSWIPAEKLQAIHAAAMRACDALDGLEDGLIDDPRKCHIDPDQLLCKAADSDNCLTQAQVTSLRAIYAGPGGKDPAGYAYYGYAPGGELYWSGWTLGPTPDASILYMFVNAFQKYLVYDDPKWSLDRFEIGSNSTDAFRRLGTFYEALDTDLSRFAARGGKLILYHGWADRALQPQLSIDYFERVRERMGAAKVATFASLYMVPGMDHVFGGNGPNVFGQMAAPPADSTPASNIGKALEAWVENGIVPGPIIGGEHINDVAAIYRTDPGSPTRTRPLCPYPQVARYRGEGSIDAAAHFSCVAP